MGIKLRCNLYQYCNKRCKHKKLHIENNCATFTKCDRIFAECVPEKKNDVPVK